MRILFLNHLALGSASTYRQAGLAKFMALRGHTVSFLGKRVRSRDLGTVDVEPQWNIFHKRAFWKEPLTTSALTNAKILAMEEAGVDVVWVNRAYPYTTLLETIAGTDLRRLAVDMEDWDGFGGYASFARLYDPRGMMLTLSEGILPRRAGLVPVVSRLLGERMLGLGVSQEKLVCVPNGFDEDFFRPSTSSKTVREELGLDDSPVVMYTSTFWKFESSQHETAISAFQGIARKVPDVKILVIGHGNLDLRQSVESAGLAKNLVFTGYVPRKRTPELMAAADVGLHVISSHPYHIASSPMVVPEYMAMGKAIVAPPIGELVTMLGGGCGVLTKSSGPTELADKTVSLLRDEGLRAELGAKARERAVNEFSYRVLADRVLPRLVEMVEEKRA